MIAEGGVGLCGPKVSLAGRENCPDVAFATSKKLGGPVEKSNVPEKSVNRLSEHASVCCEQLRGPEEKYNTPETPVEQKSIKTCQ